MSREVIYEDHNGVTVKAPVVNADFYLILHPIGHTLLPVRFQFGPTKLMAAVHPEDESGGVNGLQVEHLLAICAHRLHSFGIEDKASHTGRAVGYIRAALEELDKRTQERIAAGVEGTSAPEIPRDG